MRRSIFKWFLRAVVLYAVVAAAWFAFALWGSDSRLWGQLHSQTYVFWQGGEFYSDPPLFDPIVDRDGVLEASAATDANDVQIWVLLLEGQDDLMKFPFRDAFGLDASTFRSAERGESIIKVSVGVRFRFHPLPVYVDRKLMVVESADFLRDNYRPDCLGNLIYLRMIERYDQAAWEDCKIVK